MAKTAGFLLLALVSSALADCPTGSFYDSAFNLCFKYFPDPLSFPLAEKSCENLGGTLVVIQNAFENSYLALVAQASNSTSSDFWIGANLLMATNWEWTTGANISYSNWAPGQPTDPSMYLCAALRQTDNAWTKNVCNMKKTYMCQVDESVTPAGNSCPSTTTRNPFTGATTTNRVPATTPAPSGCPDGYCDDDNYTLNPDACKCYRLYVNQSYFFSQATTICQGQNANLTIIRNDAENNWLVNFIKKSNVSTSNVNPYIGLLCSTQGSDSCRWIDGSKPCYFNMAIGNSYYTAPGVLNENDRLWHTANSDHAQGFLCEKKGIQSVINRNIQLEPPKLNELDCPAGSFYDSAFNLCFKYFPNPLSFPLAEKNCESFGGSLVAVQNALQNSYLALVAQASNSTSPDFWIGANLLMATNWEWTTGSNVSYSNWASEQPTDPSMYLCAALRQTDNAWTKNLCNTMKSYMCQIDPNASPAGNNCPTTTMLKAPLSVTTTNKPYETTPPPSGCPKGHCDSNYTLNPDACKCYKLYNGQRYNSMGATTICQLENANLAIIRSDAENNWIGDFVKNEYNELWIGLTCSTNSIASCGWNDGTGLDCYGNLDISSTYSGSTGYMYPRYGNFWYTTTSTDTLYAFLCQKSAIPSSSTADDHERLQNANKVM